MPRSSSYRSKLTSTDSDGNPVTDATKGVENETLVPPEDLPTPPWGDRGVTSLAAGTKKPKQKDSSINVRINLDLRADVALELHAVVQGDVTIGLF